MELLSVSTRSEASDLKPVEEDQWLVEVPYLGIFDGIGGRGAGDVASKKALDLAKNFLHRSGGGDGTMPFSYQPQYLLETNQVLNCLMHVDRELRSWNKERTIHDRGAVSAALFTWSKSHGSLVTVGNMTVKLIRQGQVLDLNVEDQFSNFVPGIAKKAISNLATQALGFEWEPRVHIREFKLRSGDELIMIGGDLAPFLTAKDLLELSQRHAPDQVEAHLEALVERAQDSGCQGAPLALLGHFKVD